MLILAHPPSEYVPPRAPTGLDHPGDTEPQPTDLPGAERSVAGGAAAWAPPRVVSPAHPYSRVVARGAGAPPATSQCASVHGCAGAWRPVRASGASQPLP